MQVILYVDTKVMKRIIKNGPDRVYHVCLIVDLILTKVCMPIITDNSSSPIWERNKIVWAQRSEVIFLSMSWPFCGSFLLSHSGENIL
jgi:hypothetical protein